MSITTHEIADAIGRKEMAEALGIGLTAVSNRVVEGKFPPSWFVIVKSLCDEKDIECPESLFGMKRILDKAS